MMDGIDFLCPTMHFRQWQKHKWSSQQKGAGRKETSPLQKIKREKKAKKRRYMKSSCRWTTIHFHFEVPRTVVKCDCMWQSPSLPVYHDGYTLPPWCCWSTRVRTHIHTQIHGYWDTQEWVHAGVWTRTQNHIYDPNFTLTQGYFRSSFKYCKFQDFILNSTDSLSLNVFWLVWIMFYFEIWFKKFWKYMCWGIIFNFPKLQDRCR